MNHIALFSTKNQRYIFFFLLFCIFLINIFIKYLHYKEFIKNEIFQTNCTVLNSYLKKDFTIIKLKNSNFTAFTPINKDIKIEKFSKIDILLDSSHTTFLEYLKGFYAKNISLYIYPKKDNLKSKLYYFIVNQHKNKTISSIYTALFLSTNSPKSLKQIFSNFGVSHLFALSGFHLGLILGIVYFILNLLYSTLHQKYLPYRNKRFDILVVSSIILYGYLSLIGTPASFLRAYVMFLFGIILLRSGISLISFETLAIIVSVLLAFDPPLVFSLSLWLSVAGVFYIFLYIKYFKHLHKIISFILFNFWIFLAMSPIVHYFFYNFTTIQLLSPIISMLFILFYPIALGLHIMGYGYFFDNILNNLLHYNFEIIQIQTPLWFLIIYLGISFFSIFYKKSFIALNVILSILIILPYFFKF